MPSPSLRLLAPILLLSGLAAQEEPTAWAQRQPDLRTAPLRSLMLRARAEGQCPTPALELRCKQALRAARGKDRAGRPDQRRTDFVTRPTSVAAPELALQETESNDVWQWATDLGSATAVTGSVFAQDDVDVFRFQSTGQYYTVSVQPHGLPPILDSTLVVRNQDGEPVAFNDDDGTLLSTVHLWLPAGVCYFEVGSKSGLAGGGYQLVITADQANVQPLANNLAGITRQAGSGQHDLYQFTVPEGRLSLRAAGLGGDTVLTLQRADGALVFVNDDSRQFGADAAADIDLPAGTWTLDVLDLYGTGGVPFVLSYGFQPQPLPDLLQTPSLTGVLLGDESLRLARLTTTQPLRLDAATGGNGGYPVLDTVLALWDRDLDFVCDCDDDNVIGGHGHYSRLRLDLPATSAFLVVTPFAGRHGGYALTLATPQPFQAAGTAAFGNNQLAYSGNGIVNTFPLANGTSVGVRYRTDSYWYAVLDENGDLADAWSGIATVPQCGELPAAGAGRSNYVVCWDRYDFQGSLSVDILPPLATEQGMLLGHGKQGDMAVLFAALQDGPPIQFGLGERGFGLLPYGGGAITVGLRLLPASGEVAWAAVPAQLPGIWLQAADLHTGACWTPGPVASWRNLLRW